MAYNYWIVSDDYEVANEKIEEIRKSFGKEFEEATYQLEEEGLYAVIDELTTISLFDTPKFIVVHSFEKVAESPMNAVGELLRALNNANNENVIIFISLKNYDSANGNIQKIAKYVTRIEVKTKNLSLEEYVINNLKKDGYEIEPSALNDLSMVKQNLELLKCYTKNSKKITNADIKIMINPPLENNVYQLIESVLKNDKKQVFKSYQDLKTQSIQPSYLVSLLINKFQELYNVAILLRNRATQADISNLFGVSSGRAYYMVKNAKETDIGKIKKNLADLNDLEFKMKSGKIDQNLGLELYFLK